VVAVSLSDLNRGIDRLLLKLGRDSECRRGEKKGKQDE
jgi:hypothetical protein